MKRTTLLALLFSLTIPLVACGVPKASAEGPDACPVTQPQEPPFSPPEPIGASDEGYFWYGSPELWTQLPVDGAWRDLPHSEYGYTQKIFWGHEGYDWQAEPHPDLSVTATRLDGDAPPVEPTQGTNAYHPDFGSFMLTGVDFPTPGCWQVTGQYSGHSLSFVVWIEP